VAGKNSTRKIGLARALSKLGYCSRSQAVELIRGGRVRLNGRVRYDPETPVRLPSDRIEIDEHSRQPPEKIYLLMNKPRGLVTTASDEKGRETVYSLLGGLTSVSDGMPQPWVSPVGRLDKASEGLLLLTNDPEWAAGITAHETHLDKTYHVQIDRIADDALLAQLQRGILTLEHEMLRAKQSRLLRAGQKHCWLEIVLDEGRNRHIRRMFATLGIEVMRLVLVAIGPLQLGNLAKGKYRTLAHKEKESLDRAMQGRS
jgi:23S rRNA pseudouridine2605 synthase